MSFFASETKVCGSNLQPVQGNSNSSNAVDSGSLNFENLFGTIFFPEHSEEECKLEVIEDEKYFSGNEVDLGFVDGGEGTFSGCVTLDPTEQQLYPENFGHDIVNCNQSVSGCSTAAVSSGDIDGACLQNHHLSVSGTQNQVLNGTSVTECREENEPLPPPKKSGKSRGRPKQPKKVGGAIRSTAFSKSILSSCVGSGGKSIVSITHKEDGEWFRNPCRQHYLRLYCGGELLKKAALHLFPQNPYIGLYNTGFGKLMQCSRVGCEVMKEVTQCDPGNLGMEVNKIKELKLSHVLTHVVGLSRKKTLLKVLEEQIKRRGDEDALKDAKGSKGHFALTPKNTALVGVIFNPETLNDEYIRTRQFPWSSGKSGHGVEAWVVCFFLAPHTQRFFTCFGKFLHFDKDVNVHVEVQGFNVVEGISLPDEILAILDNIELKQKAHDEVVQNFVKEKEENILNNPVQQVKSSKLSKVSNNKDALQPGSSVANPRHLHVESNNMGGGKRSVTLQSGGFQGDNLEEKITARSLTKIGSINCSTLECNKKPLRCCIVGGKPVLLSACNRNGGMQGNTVLQFFWPEKDSQKKSFTLQCVLKASVEMLYMDRDKSGYLVVALKFIGVRCHFVMWFEEEAALSKPHGSGIFPVKVATLSTEVGPDSRSVGQSRNSVPSIPDSKGTHIHLASRTEFSESGLKLVDKVAVVVTSNDASSMSTNVDFFLLDSPVKENGTLPAGDGNITALTSRKRKRDAVHKSSSNSSKNGPPSGLIKVDAKPVACGRVSECNVNPQLVFHSDYGQWVIFFPAQGWNMTFLTVVGSQLKENNVNLAPPGGVVADTESNAYASSGNFSSCVSGLQSESPQQTTSISSGSSAQEPCTEVSNYFMNTKVMQCTVFPIGSNSGYRFVVCTVLFSGNVVFHRIRYTVSSGGWSHDQNSESVFLCSFDKVEEYQRVPDMIAKAVESKSLLFLSTTKKWVSIHIHNEGVFFTAKVKIEGNKRSAVLRSSKKVLKRRKRVKNDRCTTPEI